MLLHLTPTVFCPKRMEVNVITPHTHCVLSQTDGMLLHLTPTVFCPKRMEVNVITPYTHCVLSQTDGSQCYYTSHPLCFVPINGVLLNRLCVWILHQLKKQTKNFLLI